MKRYKEIILVVMLFFIYGANNQIFSQNENDNGKKDTTKFYFVEVMPEFIGGDEARTNFLIKNIVYPKKARRKNIEGTVFASFVVEKDGSISNPVILRGIGGGCDEEVLRIIRLMPKWKAGEVKGEKVRVQFNMPVKFILGD